jgi:myo-inositol-1(or 4)-monophosphatase
MNMATPSPETNDLRIVCIDLARQGARIARKMQRLDIPRHHKADTSIVTEADTAVENALIEMITDRFPQDAIIAEESAGKTRGADPATAQRFWIIDPIDGTRSYARCLPCFACSVAVADRQRPIAGAVVEAGTDTVYSAAAGRGAWRDAARVTVTDGLFGDLLVGVPSRNRIPLPPPVTQWVNKYVVRNYGSAALHVAMTAAGILDAALVMECCIWDIAAAGLAVQEAGGLVTDLQGQPIFPMDIPAQAATPARLTVLAAGPRSHALLLADIRAS